MNFWSKVKDRLSFSLFKNKTIASTVQVIEEKKLQELAPTVQQQALNNNETLDLGDIDPPSRSRTLKMKGFKVVDKVLEDPQVKACLNTLIFGILGQDYQIIGKDSHNGQLAKRFIDISFESFEGNLQDSIYELIAPGIIAGHSISEKLYKRLELKDSEEFEGKLFISKIKGKPTGGYSFVLDKYSNILFVENLIQGLSEDDKFLHPDKFFIFTFQKIFSNPYGQALIESLAKLVYAKEHKFEQMEIHDIKFASPTIGVEIPVELQQTRGIQEQTRKVAESVQSGNAISYPEGLKINTIGESKTGSSNDIYIARIKHINSEISLAILGNDLTTTQSQGGGTHAETKQKFRVTTIWGRFMQTQIEELINEQKIKDELDWNFDFTRKDYPKFKFIEDDSEDPTAKITRIKTGVDIKVLKPEERVQDDIYIRKELKYPELSEDEIKIRQSKEKSSLLFPEQANTEVNNFSLENIPEDKVELFEYDF